MQVSQCFGSTLFRLLLVLALTGCTSTSTSKFNLSIREEKLSNGLRIIISEDPTSPLVSYQTWVRVGSVDEVPGKTGLAHLFEHLMFKGTEKYPEGSFIKKLESIGAEVNAYTTRDYTVYYVNTTPDRLGTIVDLESDRLMGLVLNENRLETERQVVLEERRLRVDQNPAAKVEEALWNITFAEHPYQAPIIGYPRDLDHLSAEDLKSFYERNYVPSNVSIVISGKVAADEWIPKLKTAYGSLPKKPTPPRSGIKKEPEQTEERRITLYEESPGRRMAVGYRITSAEEKDSHALDLLSNILFEGQSSRGSKMIIDQKRLATAIQGTSFTPAFPGLFSIHFALTPEAKVEDVLAVLSQLFVHVAKNGVEEAELQKARNQLTMDRLDTIRTPMGLSQLFGVVTTLLGDPKRYEEDILGYDEVTQKDLKRVAEKYFKETRRNVVVQVPAEIRP
jgi:zinc protease